MRTHTELSTYNRVLSKRPVDAPKAAEFSALQALAINELQMLYLFVRWADCTDVGYTMHGVGKAGDAFRPVSTKEVLWARKQMMG